MSRWRKVAVKMAAPTPTNTNNSWPTKGRVAFKLAWLRAPHQSLIQSLEYGHGTVVPHWGPGVPVEVLRQSPHKPDIPYMHNLQLTFANQEVHSIQCICTVSLWSPLTTPCKFFESLEMASRKPHRGQGWLGRCTLIVLHIWCDLAPQTSFFFFLGSCKLQLATDWVWRKNTSKEVITRLTCNQWNMHAIHWRC